jgi:hypothetical protein
VSPLNIRLRVEASEWDHDDKLAELLLEAASKIDSLAEAAASVEKTLDDYLHLGIAPSREMWYAERDSLRAALARVQAVKVDRL